MIGDYVHRVRFENPGPPVPDGDGGFTHAVIDITPPLGWFVSIEPASPQDLERFTAGSVITMATHVVKGRYLPGVSTASRMVFGSRTFGIAGMRNVDERSIDMELLAVELVDP